MRSIAIAFGLLLFLNLSLLAQEEDITPDPDQLEVASEPPESNSETNTNTLKRFDVDLSVGTEFTFSPGNFYGPSYYIAPDFSYLVTPRFRLSGGIGLGYGQFYPLYNTSAEQDNMLPMTRLFLYARGSYFITSRLTISGIAYKAINDVPRLTRYDTYLHHNYHGMGVGFNYKFSDSFSVGFEMRIQHNSYYPFDGLMFPNEHFPYAGY